jgi:hypothetical protein
MTSVVTSVRSRLTPALEARLPELRQRAVALMFWVVVPLFCLFMLASGTDKLIRHLNNVPAGIRGTMEVTFHGCPQGVCISAGTFTSTSGTLVEYNQLGPYSWAKDEKHKVVYNATATDIIALPAHWDATATVVGMAGATGFMVLWGVCLYGAVRRRVPSADVTVPVPV